MGAPRVPPEEKAVARSVLASLSEDDIKTALKAALKEWLRDQMAEVGLWTVRGIAAAMLAGFIYLALAKSGWRIALP